MKKLATIVRQLVSRKPLIANFSKGLPMPRLVSVQIGRARHVRIQGRLVLSAISKLAACGPVQVTPMGLQGDEQADLSVHGGLAKAVYAYPSEHYPLWCAARTERGLSSIDSGLPWGSMGENLTISDLLESELWVGDVLQFANCALRVTQPREPCYKFNAAMGFNTAAKMMAQSGCCGFYLAVEQPGSLQAGEEFALMAGQRQQSVTASFQAKVRKHL